MKITPVEFYRRFYIICRRYILKLGGADSSEISVKVCQTKRRHIPETHVLFRYPFTTVYLTKLSVAQIIWLPLKYSKHTELVAEVGTFRSGSLEFRSSSKAWPE
jgi:hypothetical protein